jgi:hypothetical protein
MTATNKRFEFNFFLRNSLQTKKSELPHFIIRFPIPDNFLRNSLQSKKSELPHFIIRFPLQKIMRFAFQVFFSVSPCKKSVATFYYPFPPAKNYAFRLPSFFLRFPLQKICCRVLLSVSPCKKLCVSPSKFFSPFPPAKNSAFPSAKISA